MSKRREELLAAAGAGAGEGEATGRDSRKTVNHSYWYTEDDIRELLNASVREREAEVFAQTRLEHISVLRDNFRVATQRVLDTGVPALIPVHLHGNHWAGAIIRRQADGHIQVIYNDPMGGRLENEENAARLVEVVQEVSPEANIVDLRIRQQHSSNDCGPFTVDNLVRLATTEVSLDGLNSEQILEAGILQEPEYGSAHNIRVNHAELLPRLLVGEEVVLPTGIELAERGEDGAEYFLADILGLGRDEPKRELTEAEIARDEIAKKLREAIDREDVTAEYDRIIELANAYREDKGYYQSAGLYNYALNLCAVAELEEEVRHKRGVPEWRCRLENVEDRRREVSALLTTLEREFIAGIRTDPTEVEPDLLYPEATGRHKEALRNIRDNAREALGYISRAYPYQKYQSDLLELNEDAQAKERIRELHRAEAVRELYSQTTNQMRDLIKDMIEECQVILGMPPEGIEYAIVAFGSMARGEMTPYSDFEWGIILEDTKDEVSNGGAGESKEDEEGNLVEDETARRIREGVKESAEKIKKTKEYFTRLTHFMQFKVINLGETILPALAIKELEGWFYDDVIPRGFSMDGLMPYASKWPLGNMHVEGLLEDQRFTLMGTAEELARLHYERHYVRDGHLTTVLATSRLVLGSEGGERLVGKYEEYASRELDKPSRVEGQNIRQERALALLTESTWGYGDSGGKQEKEGHYFDVKRDLYRVPNMLIDNLGMYYGVRGKSLWDKLEELHETKVVGVGIEGEEREATVLSNVEGVNNLKIASSMVLEWRLSAYLDRGCQKDEVVSPEKSGEGVGGKLVHVLQVDRELLFRAYYTLIPFVENLRRFCTSNGRIIIVDERYYDNTNFTIGIVYKRLMEYENALITDRGELQHLEIVGNEVGIAATLNNMGNLFRDQGRYYKARAIHREVLERHRRRLEEYQLNVASILGNMSKEAITDLREALEIQKGKGKAYNPDVAITLNNMGNVYWAQGMHDEALASYGEAFERQQRGLGEDHPNVAVILNNMGAVFQKQGRHDEALANFRKALEIQRRRLGEDHVDVAYTLCNVGAVFQKQDRRDEALTSYRKALEIWRRRLGVDHPNVAVILNNMGAVFQKQGRHDEALANFRKALEIQRRRLGEDHPDLAATLGNMGVVYKYKERYDEALANFRKALEIQRRRLGEDHVDVARTLNNMGAVFQKQGRHDEALTSYRKAFEMQRNRGRKLGEPDFAATFRNAVMQSITSCSEQGNIREVIRIYELINELYPTMLEGSHHNLGCYYHIIALQERGTGNEAVCRALLEIAESNFRRAIELDENSATYTEYGNFLVRNSRLEEAICFLERAVELQGDEQGLHYDGVSLETVDRIIQEEIRRIGGGSASILASLYARFLLIDAQIKLGNMLEARVALDKFREVIFFNEAIRDRLSFKLLYESHRMMVDFDGELADEHRMMLVAVEAEAQERVDGWTPAFQDEERGEEQTAAAGAGVGGPNTPGTDQAVQYRIIEIQREYQEADVKSDIDAQLERIENLGRKYRAIGNRNGEGLAFARAAGLFNFCINLCKDKEGNIRDGYGDRVSIYQKHLRAIEGDYIRSVGAGDIEAIEQKLLYPVAATNHKMFLQQIRERSRQELEELRRDHDPYALMEELDSLLVARGQKSAEDREHELRERIREVEEVRSEGVRSIYQGIEDGMKQLISSMVQECEQILGLPPCQYAVVAFGSMARGEMTPYSDLEWGIILDNNGFDESTEGKRLLVEAKEYFRKLTHLMHIKVINLGETILPALAIKELNDYTAENPILNWFYDDVTPRGFSFDGLMPHASKWPLGNRHVEGLSEAQKFELIGTRRELLEYQLAERISIYESSGIEHLDDVLAEVICISDNEGSNAIYQNYLAGIREVLGAEGDGTTISRSRALKTLKADCETYDTRLREPEAEGKLYEVKKEIYRLPQTLLSGLGLYHNVRLTNSWDVIAVLRDNGEISEEAAHNLRVVTGISTELRLGTYLHNNAQRERMSIFYDEKSLRSIFAQEEKEVDAELRNMFVVPSQQMLFRFYFTAIPLHRKISNALALSALLILNEEEYFSDSFRNRGLICYKLLRYDQAQRYLLSSELNDYESLAVLGHLYAKTGEYRLARTRYEQAKELIEGTAGARSLVYARILNMIGATWSDEANLEEARERVKVGEGASLIDSLRASFYPHLLIAQGYYDDAESIIQNLQEVNTERAQILLAKIHNNQGVIFWEFGDHESINKCLECFNVSLFIYEKYNRNLLYTSTLENLINVYTRTGGTREAEELLNKCDRILIKNFGNKSPTIAHIYVTIANFYLFNVGDIERGRHFNDRALLIFQEHYSRVTPEWNNVLQNNAHISFLLDKADTARSYFDRINPDSYTLSNAPKYYQLGAQIYYLIGDNDRTLNYYRQYFERFEEYLGNLDDLSKKLEADISAYESQIQLLNMVTQYDISNLSETERTEITTAKNMGQENLARIINNVSRVVLDVLNIVENVYVPYIIIEDNGDDRGRRLIMTERALRLISGINFVRVDFNKAYATPLSHASQYLREVKNIECQANSYARSLLVDMYRRVGNIEGTRHALEEFRVSVFANEEDDAMTFRLLCESYRMMIKYDEELAGEHRSMLVAVEAEAQERVEGWMNILPKDEKGEEVQLAAVGGGSGTGSAEHERQQQQEEWRRQAVKDYTVGRAEALYNNPLLNNRLGIELLNLAAAEQGAGGVGLVLKLSEDPEIAEQLLEAAEQQGSGAVIDLLFNVGSTAQADHHQMPLLEGKASGEDGATFDLGSNDRVDDKIITYHIPHSRSLDDDSVITPLLIIGAAIVKFVESKEAFRYIFSEVIPINIDISVNIIIGSDDAGVGSSEEQHQGQAGDSDNPYQLELYDKERGGLSDFISEHGGWIGLHLIGGMAVTFSFSSEQISLGEKILSPVISTSSYASRHLYHSHVKQQLLGEEYAQSCMMNVLADAAFGGLGSLPYSLITGSPVPVIYGTAQVAAISGIGCLSSGNQKNDGSHYISSAVASIVTGVSVIYSYQQGALSLTFTTARDAIYSISKVASTVSIASLVHRTTKATTDVTYNWWYGESESNSVESEQVAGEIAHDANAAV